MTGKWLTRAPLPESAALLFCLPYSGCGASMYRSWPRFAGGIELCPVQLPGRENRMREPVPDTYEEIAEAVAAALRPELDRPYGLFGHCGSALLAYQTAVELQRTGAPRPAHVFVSSQVAPDEGPYGRFLRMDREALRTEVAELMRRTGNPPVPDLVELCLDVLTTDVAVNRRYRPETRTVLDTALTAIAWTDDAEVEPWRTEGWERYGTPTHRALLDGGHHSFLDAPAPLLDLFATGLVTGLVTGSEMENVG
ncbi:thioesterase domain-containing protein [Phytohabitans sp. ZYX-F-186]|uniref:Thioesterase domain-containing protein n=1 Tax=Phytohabitans maris TaxID=3071409 RepID=A0ABU0ZDN7_9ACTN|nr:thioesterase domain-containing protein [Phytohabitans sp. ZYX-F-186]MDQ7905171.1 thioesterase domain-containing protein [Phytohabitans sp. ZYX-F-186]